MESKPGKSKIVSYTPEALPPLTEAQIANLKGLAARPDSEIDFSAASELTDEQWKNAERGRFYRPVKGQIRSVQLGLKPRLILGALSARLKPCPCYKAT
jgi:hypothetical protein